MKITAHAMSVETFAPMLKSLVAILDRGTEHVRATKSDADALVDARLAPDMYSLARQVENACYMAEEGVARLTGKEPAPRQDPGTSMNSLKARIEGTMSLLNAMPPSEFEGADEREISIPLPNGGAIVMNGMQLLRDWSLPHFYFHLVTAYDILRHEGVQIGKMDYLSRVGEYVRPPKA